MALDIDNMGRVRAVRQDLNPGGARVYHRCALSTRRPRQTWEKYVVHEYHLLRMLGELLANNSTRTLEDVCCYVCGEKLTAIKQLGRKGREGTSK